MQINFLIADVEPTAAVWKQTNKLQQRQQQQQPRQRQQRPQQQEQQQSIKK